MNIVENFNKDSFTETIKPNSLIHADCLEAMKYIESKSVDMILCDLPYGTTACKWDVVIPFEPLWEQYKRVIKDSGAIVLFGSQPFTSLLISSNFNMFRYCWVWNKNKATNFMSAQLMPLLKTEDICVFSHSSSNCMSKTKICYYPQGIIRIDKKVKNGKNVGGKVAQDRCAVFKEGKEYLQEYTNYPNNIIDIPNDTNKHHPTEKPVALLEYLIKTYTLKGETVLDNCMGSGSTGVACINTKRNFIGIEQLPIKKDDPDYFGISVKRIQEAKQQDIFDIVRG